MNKEISVFTKDLSKRIDKLLNENCSNRKKIKWWENILSPKNIIYLPNPKVKIFNSSPVSKSSFEEIKNKNLDLQ